MSDKEFAKLSREELRTAVEIYAESQRAISELSESISNEPEKFRELLGTGTYWAPLYEKAHHELLTLFIHLTSKANFAHEFAPEGNTHRTLLGSLNTHPSENSPGEHGDISRIRDIIALAITLSRNIECMILFGRFMNELLISAKAGHDTALFHAIQVDRSVLACPTIAARIAQAEMDCDGNFFSSLARAMKTKPKKPKEELFPLRAALFLLEDAGALQQLTMKKAYELFCEDLNIYPLDGDATARNLWKFISRWKKLRST